MDVEGGGGGWEWGVGVRIQTSFGEWENCVGEIMVVRCALVGVSGNIDICVVADVFSFALVVIFK